MMRTGWQRIVAARVSRCCRANPRTTCTATSTAARWPGVFRDTEEEAQQQCKEWEKQR